ncbi:hypothetical protein GWI33_000948 [Rhynchophorus ferrugineus]|uniref:Uncharacterized protein n=1 Tax=Rhynchophorus ferrugineus TaxID=354439 RepID=A0A834IZG7_RHYFE|nr:hypothetical protein GWI33_000948 [Rhynchophorus ferrugineus]
MNYEHGGGWAAGRRGFRREMRNPGDGARRKPPGTVRYRLRCVREVRILKRDLDGNVGIYIGRKKTPGERYHGGVYLSAMFHGD